MVKMLTKTCVVCGCSFPTRAYNARTCTEECRKVRNAEICRIIYHNKIKHDPEARARLNAVASAYAKAHSEAHARRTRDYRHRHPEKSRAQSLKTSARQRLATLQSVAAQLEGALEDAN